MRRTLIAVVAGAIAVATPARLAGQATPSADELARKIQAHFDTVRDMKADFTTTYKNAFLRAQPPSRGKMQLKKPRRWLWTYDAPRKDRFWADGVRAYQYDAESKNGWSAPIPEPGKGGAAWSFLLGTGNIPRDFATAMDPSQPGGEWRLTLKPRVKQDDFSDLTLIVDRATYALRGIIRRDEQGGTETFTFSNLKENVGLNDTAFTFNFPKDTVIIR